MKAGMDSDHPQFGRQANSSGPSSGAIRHIGAMFGELREYEERRQEMMQIEEEELGFAPDKEEHVNEADVHARDSGSDGDSDASDGELAGEARQHLLSDIIGAIDTFCQ